MKYIGLFIILLLLSSCSHESPRIETSVEKKDTSSVEIGLSDNINIVPPKGSQIH